MSDGEFQIPDDPVHPIDRMKMYAEHITSLENTPEGRFRKEMEENFLKAKPLMESGWIDMKTKNYMTGIELITQERLEQKVKHGRSVKFDAENNSDGELIQAARALMHQELTDMPEEWDVTMCNQMLRKSYLERLIRAGALIAAEIDRLNYKP